MNPKNNLATTGIKAATIWPTTTPNTTRPSTTIQQTHTCGHSNPTNTGHNNGLRTHSQQTYACECSFPTTGFFESTCTHNNPTKASLICCPTQTSLHSPTKEPTSASVFSFSLFPNTTLCVTARVYCLPTCGMHIHKARCSSLTYPISRNLFTSLLGPQVSICSHGIQLTPSTMTRASVQCHTTQIVFATRF